MLFAEIRRAALERCGVDPYIKFLSHRNGAAARGIEFEMTFEEWWAIWEPRFADRGRKVGQVVMCRAGDEGPYRTGNVRIDTVTANHRERCVVLNRAAVRDAWGDSTASDWLDGRQRVRGYFEQNEPEEEEEF